MTANTDTLIDSFVKRELLPTHYASQAREYFVPLAHRIDESCVGKTLIVGVHGCQGSGKSTLTALLVDLLQGVFGRSCAALSLDDLYLTRAERQTLAQQVQPLLATRGVPGTHDVALGLETLRGLAEARGPMQLPRFDKSIDDRADIASWPTVTTPVDVVLFEGWCMALPAQDATALTEPVNALERDEDGDGRWRRYVNEQLALAYPPLFAQLDALIMLQAPDFDCVYRWREQQEAALVARTGRPSPLQDPQALARFIAHYERLTRHALAVLPAQADCVLRIGADQRVADSNYQRRWSPT